MPRFLLFALSAFGALAFCAHASDARAAETESDADDRKLWAYPEGVIVSTGGNETRANKMPKTKSELRTLTTAVESMLDACARKIRKSRPELVTEGKGERYLFTLTFDIGASGKVSDAKVRKSVGSAELPGCVDEAESMAEKFSFTPLVAPKDEGKEEESDAAVARPSPTPTPKLSKRQQKRLAKAEAQRKKRKEEEWRSVGASIPFEIVILTDDEAQGRGYQYLVAERGWEKALRDNAQWFACTRDEDCVLTYEMCEVRAVNAASEKGYLEAVRKRRKPACREPEKSQVLHPVCRSERCSAVDAAVRK